MTQNFAALLSTAAPNDRQAHMAYYRARLPDPKDEALTQVVEAYQQLAAADRAAAAAALTEMQVGWLSTYAYRMAMLSVRQENPRLLHNGIVAMLLIQPKNDWRETLMSLTLLYRSATLLELGNAAFEAAAEFAPTADARQQLLSFLTSPAETKHVESMGWRELTGLNGLIYVYGTQPVPEGLQ